LRFRGWVRPGSGGRHVIGFSKVGRPLRPPSSGAAAGGAVLPKRNQRNIDPRTPAGPPRFLKQQKLRTSGYTLGSPYFRIPIMLPVPAPGRASWASSGPVLAASPMQRDQKPVPNCRGLRPGQFGTGFSFVCIVFADKTGPRPAPEARSGDRTIAEPKVSSHPFPAPGGSCKVVVICIICFA
jgi:hypothetical protein